MVGTSDQSCWLAKACLASSSHCFWAWLAEQHGGERHNLIARLQSVAKTKNVRVSFVGGDVHVAGVGRLYTQPKIHRLRYDHRFMPQVLTTATYRLRNSFFVICAWNAALPETLQ